MKKRTRRTLFIVFLGAFLVTAPLVVLYTAGYRYNFGTGRVVQTGVLSVSSIPKGAEILLDGTDEGVATPSLLKNVFPGDHELSAVKDGYSSWKKTLPVESKKTTFADDIVLFFNAPASIIRNTDLRAVSLNVQGTKAAYAATKGQWTEIWIDSLSNGSETLVSRLPVGTEATIRFDWLEDGSVLSTTASDRGTDTVTLVYTDTGTAVASLPASDITLSPSADRVAVSRSHGESNEILAYVPFGEYVVESGPTGLIQLEDRSRGRLVLVQPSGGDNMEASPRACL